MEQLFAALVDVANADVVVRVVTAVVVEVLLAVVGRDGAAEDRGDVDAWDQGELGLVCIKNYFTVIRRKIKFLTESTRICALGLGS